MIHPIATTTVAAATVSGSLGLTADEASKAVMSEASELAAGGGTRTVLVTALDASAVGLSSASVGELTCSDAARIRKVRRLEDVSFDLCFTASFSDVSSASTVLNEVVDASSTLENEFEREAAASLNVTLTASIDEVSVVAATFTTLEGETSGLVRSSIMPLFAIIEALFLW